MAGERKQKVLSKTAAMATITNMEKKRYPKIPAPTKARVDPAAAPDSGSLKSQVFLLQLFQEIFM